ncbi:MAG: threo-3-hydroxy-L-aspartate ammonia-lyase [Bosea sp. (in: a-proteobacteria)]
MNMMLSAAAALPTYADVEAAARRIDGVAHRTPVLTSRTANAATGAELFFKCENFQRMGAFKFRGAYNAISSLSAAEKARGVLAFSSGNHAQGTALAGQLLGVAVTILMPSDAPAAKIAATRGYGAEVITFDRYSQDRELLTRQVAAERGSAIIPPFNHPNVIAGQGTSAKELIEEVGPLDMLFVCLGGGGLLAGCALAAHALSPGIKVIGVEPEAGDDGRQSLRAGHIIKIDVPKTIADGTQTQALGDITFAIIRRDVADIVTVSDAELIDAMRFAAERMKMVVEPSGALGMAAAMTAKVAVRGLRVGVVVSGGNTDLASFARMIGP